MAKSPSHNCAQPPQPPRHPTQSPRITTTKTWSVNVGYSARIFLNSPSLYHSSTFVIARVNSNNQLGADTDRCRPPPNANFVNTFVSGNRPRAIAIDLRHSSFLIWDRTSELESAERTFGRRPFEGQGELRSGWKGF